MSDSLRVLSHVTLAIPTHNRHRYLRRVLDYFAGQGIRVVVGDSSETPFPEAANYEIQYWHLPGMSLNAKWATMARRIESEYSVFCPDDDFIAPSGISRCVEFLDARPEYSSAQGVVIHFYNGRSVRWFVPFGPQGEMDINGDDPLTRVRQLFSNYMYLVYSVHRTDSIRTAFELNNQLPSENGALSQFLVDVACVAHGRSKTLPVFYAAREALPRDIEPTLAETRDFVEVCASPSGQIEYQVFLSILGKHLFSLGASSTEEAVRCLGAELTGFMESPRSRVQIPHGLVSPFIGVPFLQRALRKVPLSNLAKRAYAATVRQAVFGARQRRLDALGKVTEGFPAKDGAALSEWRIIESCIRSHGTTREILAP
jgi:glycosyltransferase domain-containing protein